MQSLTQVIGVAVPMIEDDLNTDQMAPLQLAKGLKPDYADLLFKRRRQNPDGSLIADYVLNQPQFKAPSILVAGLNFGCGSSRESAVWCLFAVGIRCVIARSIADIFRENCLQNGVLPIELDGPAMDDLQRRVLAANGAAPAKILTEDYQAEPLPPGVHVELTETQGPVFADSKGKTLYIWRSVPLRVQVLSML